RDAIVIQDISALERGADEGHHVIESLRALAAIESLAPDRAATVNELAPMVERFLGESQITYAEALANPNEMTTSVQRRMGQLASRTETLNTSLDQLDREFSGDL